jgi:hypothetical protein
LRICFEIRQGLCPRIVRPRVLHCRAEGPNAGASAFVDGRLMNDELREESGMVALRG